MGLETYVRPAKAWLAAVVGARLRATCRWLGAASANGVAPEGAPTLGSSRWYGGAMDLGPDREFGYHVKWRVAGAALGCAMIVAIPVVWTVTFWRMSMAMARYGQPSLLPRIGWGETWVIAVYGAFGIAHVLALIHDALLGRNGSVLVTRVSIVVRDWRGRDSRMFWEEVEELRAMVFLRNTPFAPILELRGQGRRMRIAGGIEDGVDLCELIIAQAGLAEKHAGWFLVVHRRPAQT